MSGSAAAVARLVPFVVAIFALCGCAGDAEPTATESGGRDRAGHLAPIPARAIAACRRAQARSQVTVVCPARLPRPPERLRLRVYPVRSLEERGAGTPLAGAQFEYGAPAGRSEPLWRNGPRYALHFVVLWVPDRPGFVPAGARPATLAGRRGLLRDASGLGRGRCRSWPQCFYWANHTWFTWRSGGARYVASVHFYGHAATRSLLATLIEELRPAVRLAARDEGSSRTSRSRRAS